MQISVDQEIKLDKKTWQIQSLHIKFSYGESWKERYSGIIKEWAVNLTDMPEGEVIKEPCSNCLGIGSNKTFSIPKEDLESGLTGYALYSCNKINAAVACIECGGSGTRYEDWYLKENPDLDTSTPFVKGKGSTKTPLMDNKQTLNF